MCYSSAHVPCLAPKYHTHSRQVTPRKEAARLTKYAEQLLVSVGVSVNVNCECVMK